MNFVIFFHRRCTCYVICFLAFNFNAINVVALYVKENLSGLMKLVQDKVEADRGGLRVLEEVLRHSNRGEQEIAEGGPRA